MSIKHRTSLISAHLLQRTLKMKLSVFVLLNAAYLLSTHCIYSQPEVDNADNDAQVLILGAGIGGMHAVRLLRLHNISDFIVIEGDSVIGGGLKSHVIDDLEFETGRPWFHKQSKFVLDAVGAQYKENDYESVIVLDDAGQDVTSDFNQVYEQYASTIGPKDKIAQDAIDGKRLDVDQRTSLAMSGWCSGNSSLHNLHEFYEIDFNYGTPTRHTSTVGPYTQDLDLEYYIWDRNGTAFKDVHQWLPGDERLRLNKVVQNIDHSGDKVVVTTADGTEYTGLKVLVTFSIGVLQYCDVTFTPPLPTWKNEQIFRFQRGVVDPIILKFPSKFWADDEWILHPGKYPGYYPAFLNAEVEGLYPAGTNVLIAFVTGDEAIRVERLTDAELEAEVVGVLRGMYGDSAVPDPISIFMERWWSNPLHRGTQSTWPIPANVPAADNGFERLQAHVGNLFFANDAAVSQFNFATAPLIGTVEGQIDSVDDAVWQIIQIFNDDLELEDFQPGSDVCTRAVESRPDKLRKQTMP